MLDLKGKSVLITGGSRGIGAASVRLFAQCGANVAFSYHQNRDAAESVLNELNDTSGNHFTQKCDVGEFSDVIAFVNKSIQTFGSIDVLVNNAGIWEYGAIDSMSEEQWQSTLHINLDSVFYFTKLVVAHMRKAKIQGRIVHIASTAGQRGEPFHSHYAATKGAIISFTKSLAVELGPLGIRVNCVAPGWVNTDMSREAIRKDGDKIVQTIPLQYIPEAEEIAGSIVFLASDWSTAITGEILNVNAGSVLCG
jgi:3-oxoacyl-[acyl-carrier protein] reductase